ncbi:helix-turn-helix transcriptional regulator [Tabrizicola sp.]|uniref:helix-turn-helix transcriptional regulator n=1 Tax=Tabrizicola sp. TaxID=2005166 RepID=UPI003F3219FB
MLILPKSRRVEIVGIGDNSLDDFDRILGEVYDCAANPDLWPQTLERIRSSLGFAYAMFGYTDLSMHSSSGVPMLKVRSTSWDTTWFERLERYLPDAPGLDRLWRGGLDVPWVQMEHVEEAEFHKTELYNEWVRPQGLRDCMNILFYDRKLLRGAMTFTTSEGSPLIGKRQKDFVARIVPHIRRAVSINSMVDRSNLALALYRKVLDALSVAVLIVDGNGRLVYGNALADAILSKGDFLAFSQGHVRTRRMDGTVDHLQAAIARAAHGAQSLGISGIGVPLVSADGERASAYVLPLEGNDLRGELAPGHAAIFIAQRSEQQPMAVEILRTIFGLTPSEAKVAYAMSLGEAPQAVAAAQGTTVNAVRYHLKNAYAKVGVNDKTALAARVTALIPPVA